MARFLIRHPKTGEEYGLDSLTDYRKKRGADGQSYEDRGFVIPDEQPHGWTAPKVKAESAPRSATKAAAGTNDGETA